MPTAATRSGSCCLFGVGSQSRAVVFPARFREPMPNENEFPALDRSSEEELPS